MSGDLVRDSVFGFLAYDPDSLINVTYFKILATPSVIPLFYFYFRWRNAGAPSYPGSAGPGRDGRIGFSSPLLRAVLTSIVTIHWIGMEWWKFNVDGFYPYSDLESRSLNIGVLILSQALAFVGMKHLSLEPHLLYGALKDGGLPDRP
jgi:hypothetical protein